MTSCRSSATGTLEPTAGLTRPGIKRLALSIVAIALLALLALPQAASATHLRHGELTWEQIGANEARFDATISWRRSGIGNPNVGDSFNQSLNTGDGSITLTGEVVFVDAANDVATTQTDGEHQYSGPGPFTAFIQICCRLSPPLHRNNGDLVFRIETLVDFAQSTASPASNISPIIDCPLDDVCQFTVPAFDPEGRTLQWRFATGSEAGSPAFVQPGPPQAPNPATINANNGLYSWDTTGASLNPGGDSFYSTQVMVEKLVGGDLVSRTPLDFFIRLTDDPNNPPTFQPPTPADGTELDACVGEELSFGVRASDPDAGDNVTLSILNMPSGATFDTTPGNPATGTFRWMPPAAGLTQILTLIARDDQGRQALQRSVTIRTFNPDDPECADAPPPPDEACPPSNRFHLGKLFRDRQEGTGKIAAHVPGAGTLILHRVRSDGKLRQDRLEVDEGGRYFLDVIPRGRTARKLEGASPGGPPVREQVRIGVTFNPNGGVPALDRARLYLIQRHGAPPPEPLPPTGGGDAPPSPFVGSDGCPIFPFIGLAKLRQSPDTGRPNQVVIVRGLDEIDEDAHLILTRNKRVRAARVELEGDGKTTIPVRLHGEALRELNRGFRAGERSRVEARLSIELFVGGLRETVRKRHVGVVRDGR